MENKSIAYTVKEKLLLASLIDQNGVVENKKTDAATIQKKQEEWQKIAAAYNAQGDIISTTRTAVQLKKSWNNLKQRKRKATTELKYNKLKTGGGPPPVETEDEVMAAVDVAAPYADVMLENCFDSTAIYVDEKKSETEPLLPEPQQLPPPSATIGENSTTTPSRFTSAVRRKAVDAVENECSLRVKKMREAIEQQDELHSIRILIVEEELRKTVAERKKAEAEAELAILKLEIFKKENAIE